MARRIALVTGSGGLLLIGTRDAGHELLPSGGA
jgi:hypothetical protein